MISRHLILLTGLLFVSSSTHAATGILELDSKPGGAEVFVDGKKKGTTPETEGQKLTMELAEGDHEIVIKKEGTGSATKKVFIGEGVIQPLTLTIMAEAFTNPLGMKFVPVPGTQILMCIHETRNKDYAQYAAESSGVDMSWKDVKFYVGKKMWTIKEDAEHPVINVSWEDAMRFCAWLGGNDGRTYRLPTDHEWSCAVGIGDRENKHDTPEAKDGVVLGYPWGVANTPPKDNIGNFLDSDAIEKSEGFFTESTLYHDGVLLTSKVMSYPANKLGIYDLEGNVKEWCQDLYTPSENWRVMRGGTWDTSLTSDGLLSSNRAFMEPYKRNSQLPGYRLSSWGFRCVVVVTGSSSD